MSPSSPLGLRSLCCAALAVACGTTAATAQKVEFNRDIRPLLAENCFLCHGPDAGHRKAKLRLDVANSAYADRKGSPAIVPGHPERSELVRRITAADPDDRMPPVDSHKELTADNIATLRRWIAAGAVYEEHWSTVPARRRPLPGVADRDWCRNFVDRWILMRLQQEGLAPSPAADDVTLVRRLHLDLTGLPPTPRDLEALSANDSADAYADLVDRLLASPHFGERMAMYWLDLVRFADTVGYHGDQAHHIAPYRDWVIDAFNDNMPFDQFTIEQLAGDLLPEPTVEQRIATGYNRVLQTTHEGGAQAAEYLAIYAADRVRNLGAVWMGATLGCAQCHDHKYDPYTARDFYAMKAFFADIKELGDFKGSPNSTPTTRPPEMLVFGEQERTELKRIGDELAQLTARGGADSAEIARLEKALAEVRKRGRRTMVTVSVKPRVTRVLPRGDWLDETGEVVQPAVPHFMPQIEASAGKRATRLDLARWLTAPDHPQTARVFVNRLWYLLFGVGLSRRLDDLGAQGEWPVHPELLDTLAVEFVESGFDVKHLMRTIVTSSTYRQSSVLRPELTERDRGNRLVARQSRWRVPAETVRDTALAVSGLLVTDVGGHSVKPYQPTGYYRHMNFPQRKYRAHEDARQWRRGVYVHWQRQFLHPALLAFDAPTREECTAERSISNTPQASLTLLNDPTFVEAARAFATRVLREGGGDDNTRLRHAFELALSRPPAAAESAVLLSLLSRHRAEYRTDPNAAAQLLSVGLTVAPEDLDPAELAAWSSVTRAILNLHETITRS